MLDEEKTVNPLIEVETCGIVQFTKPKKDVPTSTKAMPNTTPQVFKDHLFFEPRNMHKTAIESETISIKVKNKGLFKSELIGNYDFDLTKIYFEDSHAIQHQWIAMCNPESSDFGEVSGYLKVSIAV